MTKHELHIECPHCGFPGDLLCNFQDAPAPQPGDSSMCPNCAELLAFNEDMKLIEPSIDQMLEWQKVPGLWEFLNIKQALLKAGPNFKTYRKETLQ